MKVIQELIRYVLLHIVPVNFYFKKLKRKELLSGMKVSLTTTPERIGSLKPTICSLLDQSKKVDQIIINLALPPDVKVPSFLNHPYILINRLEEDLGPATKLIPTLRIVKESDQIIVLDDDQVYPRKLAESYHKASDRFPNAALCMVGWSVPKSMGHEDRLPVYGAKFRLMGQKPPVQVATTVDIMQGASSFMVKPSFFKADVFDYNDAPPEAFFVDDIWFSGHLAKANVKKIVFPGDFQYCRLSNMGVASETGLVKTANKGHLNNNVLYDHFKSYWQYNTADID